MTAPPSKRPWWRRKRTWAAAAWLALPVLYPLSYGPFCYCQWRKWIPNEPVAFYAPIDRAVPAYWGPIDGPRRFPSCVFPPGHPVNDWYWAYLTECCRLGKQHRAASD